MIGVIVLTAALLGVSTTYGEAATLHLDSSLEGTWTVRNANGSTEVPAVVPGGIYTDLRTAGILEEDIYYRFNDIAYRWVSQENWTYSRNFEVDHAFIEKENIFLVFHGVDTVASVYLNDEHIGDTDNMFVRYSFPVKSVIKNGTNKLEVRFESSITAAEQRYQQQALQYPVPPTCVPDEYRGECHVNHLRKMQASFSWDWGPAFPSAGLWKDVVLEAFDVAVLREVTTNTTLTENSWLLEIGIFLEAGEQVLNVSGIFHAKLNLDVDPVNKTAILLADEPGQFNTTLLLEIPKDKVQLWWPNGFGSQKLYNLLVAVQDVNGNQIGDVTLRIGFRTIELIQEPVELGGLTFYIKVNNLPIFSKGSNWIPSHVLPEKSADPEVIYNLLSSAKDVHMNMLRVWGGGLYESDLFYQLADEFGILIWQDFMFACSLYPSEGEFLENIRQEAIDNVKRLRNHPSIALWCGNNEVYYFWTLWNFDEYYREQSPEYEKIIWKQYTDLFDGVLPQTVNEYSPGTFYWPSSPYNKNKDEDHNGDRHYWGVWHGQEPTYQFNEVRSRFFSEYGFQSFPEFESVKIFAPEPDDWNITSEVMMAHQRAGNYANPRIREYLLNEYKEPTDFKGFLYMGQVLQGDAIKIAIEAHRRDRPYCMGTLFWQHNDCWPVASWASRDYYGRWKAQHYFSREAYRDLLVSPIAKDGKLNVYLVSDRLKETSGQLDIQVIRLNGQEVNRITKNIRIPANTSTLVYAVDTESLLNGTPAHEVLVVTNLTGADGKKYSNRYFLVKQKEIDFPEVKISKTIQAVAEGYEVALKSDQFARAVFLSIAGIDNFFEDNYFDILPGQTVKVQVRTKLPQAELEKQLKITSFRNYCYVN
jgi:beta-mannosidase